MLHAVIGVGSNSTRYLLGEITGNKVQVLRRMREGTRLFAGLEEGMLQEEHMLRTVNAAAMFAKDARDAGCEHIHLIGTSAARDAKNGDTLCELVESLCGVPLSILSGKEEARLSFLGAAGTGFCGMLDIGGGSTELATGGGGRPLRACSVQLGAARLKGERPDLSGSGLAQATALAESRVKDTWSHVGMGGADFPDAWYGVGGTLTCLAALDMRLKEFDRDVVEGHALTREIVEAWAESFTLMTEIEIMAIPGLQPQRADIIAHGTVALLGVMRALDIPRVVVSNKSNLDGYLRDIADKGSPSDSVETVRDYYDAAVEKEWERLKKNFFELEINRRYIDRYVNPGDRVLDVGGGPGRYSLYLAERGADVTLLDLSPGNVAFAREKAKEKGLSLQIDCADARDLAGKTEGLYDVVLLMGPLYHLQSEEDRRRAVEECLKRLKPGGVLCVAFVSVVAGMIYAARTVPDSILWESESAFYEHIIAQKDFTGMGFTQVYFVIPEHVKPFMESFPLETLHLVASEGITAPFADKLLEQPPEVADKWLALSLLLCEREDFWNYTEHFLYIGRKEA